jgi:hypothetical protein
VCACGEGRGEVFAHDGAHGEGEVGSHRQPRCVSEYIVSDLCVCNRVESIIYWITVLSICAGTGRQ